MAEQLQPKAVDLENELTCAVCTEILYQPLTLLDCLHTFCGSCLKIWFQAASSRGNPHTCPACRNVVRATSSDAKINTLLDMYLQLNPDKAKSEEERKEIASRYTKGENVLPKRSERRRDEPSNSDRRMVDEFQEMSLRDSHSRDYRQGYERGVRHRQRSRERRRAEQGTRTAAENNAQARHIERQSSLRSVISTEELDSNAMVDEILRQISEEGLLEGIDIFDPAQQDELVQRISEAYRRRVNGERRPPANRTSESQNDSSLSVPGSRTRARSSRSRSSNRSPSTTSVSSRSPGDGSSARRHARSTSATEEGHTSHPPVSRPHLLDTDTAIQPSRPRRSNESRRHTSSAAERASAPRQASRSATDLSTDSNTSTSPTSRPIEINSRRNTEPRNLTQAEGEGLGITDTGVQPRSRNSNPTSTSQRASDTSPRRSSGQRPPNIEITRSQHSSAPTTPRLATSTQVQRPPQTVLDSSVVEPSQSSRSKMYREVSVNCDRCGKEHIEYELHEHCSICQEGSYNICHECYRQGKGCLHWFGFGDLAWYQFRQSVSQQDPPHALVGRKYIRPKPGHIQPNSTNGTIMTSEDPSKRLQSGAFCSRCHRFADDCFWKCGECNEGEWGYCNECVNTGYCCSHSLLPLANASVSNTTSAFATDHPEASFAPITSPSMLQAYPPTNTRNPAQYRPLTFSTSCNICHYPIQPSQSRFHCYTCSNGNYDICSLCYARLIDSGRISRENGDKGWRKCLNNHRMVKAWFEDSQLGQRRVIVNDLVGGLCFEDRTKPGEWSWVEGEQRRTRSLAQRMFDENKPVESVENTILRKFPPDGGIGFHVRAIHPRLPAAGSKDELSFPRGAEIWEAQEISADWYHGSYAGERGLFPVNHVMVLGQITTQ